MVEIRRLPYTFDVVSHLVAREFRLRYRNALLAWTWALVEPLVRLAVLSFVFSRVVPLGIPDYGAFLFTGLIAWTWFSAGLVSATTSALDRRDLLFRPGVSRTTVPVVSVLSDGIDYMVALPVLAVFLVAGPGIPVTALALPVVLAAQLLLMLGLGFALCTANVFLRDVRPMIGVALTAGFYLTPVFYEPSSLPDRYRFLVRFNPMARLVDAHREILIEGTLPAPGPFLLLTAACVAIFAVGLAIYRRYSSEFVDEL